MFWGLGNHSVAPGYHPALRIRFPGVIIIPFSRGYHPTLQTRFPGAITPRYKHVFPGLSPRATNNGTPTGVLLCFVNGICCKCRCRIETNPFPGNGIRVTNVFPGLSPRATNTFSRGYHPALQTMELLPESYYVLLMVLVVNAGAGGIPFRSGCC
ncbi:hypothetical protein SAMN04488121_101826 [Chitinophaga filiformis]|uniref:Uncharacterized protein n=1 Tax=Chitinophaga filiformis TaxID=104663 RepID=A0A1G7IFB4_CHIFI|nr:hypothetical protein SAMN04488121_101826 [Chitinophaga filiformis]